MTKLCRDSIHNKLCNTRVLRKVPSSNLLTDNRDVEKVTEINFVEIKGMRTCLRVRQRNLSEEQPGRANLNTPLTDAKPVKRICRMGRKLEYCCQIMLCKTRL